MVYRQNLRNHIVITGFTWAITLFFIFCWWYFDFATDFLLVVGLFYLLITIPAVYLHIEYSIVNFGDKLEIDQNSIRIFQKGELFEYKKTELRKIVIYKSASLDGWGMPLSQMEYYRFARIITNSGKEIVITCLLCRNIDEEVHKFKTVPIQRKKSFFCTTWWR